MKVVRKFVYTEKSGGAKGWVLVGKPHFDPVGFGHRNHVLMHDIFEHHNDDGDEVQYEFMALGATFMTRVLGGWRNFNNGFSRPTDIMAQDTLYFITLNNFEVPEPPADTEYSSELGYYFKYIRRMRSNYDNRITVEMCERALKWLSIGFARAKKRWMGNTPKAVTMMWHLFEDKIRAAQAIQMAHREPGARFHVMFDTETLETSFRFIKPRNAEKRDIPQWVIPSKYSGIDEKKLKFIILDEVSKV